MVCRKERHGGLLQSQRGPPADDIPGRMSIPGRRSKRCKGPEWQYEEEERPVRLGISEGWRARRIQILPGRSGHLGLDCGL